MSKKNKIVYSNVQPNTKEAGVWVNTDDGNVKVEKDGKWVDDGGSGSSDGKWEYYKIDRNDASFNAVAMNVVFSFVTLDNAKQGDTVYIMPKGPNWDTTVAIAGISAKKIAGEFVVDTGSWLGDIKELDKLWGRNYNYSFLKPITKEEFYSDNFDYPVNGGGPA